MLIITLFLLSAAAIYGASEYFVNGIEWLGRKLSLGETATGTVLAAFGTALPESAVTFIAVVFGKTGSQRDIGVGAAMGGPLVLATIGYAAVGIALWMNHRRLRRNDWLVQVEHRRLARDQGWFLGIFVIKCVLGLVAFAWKPWLGLLFLLAYTLYVRGELRRDEASAMDEPSEPLKICPQAADPSLTWVLLQTLLAIGVIAVASRVFVHQIEAIGAYFQLSSQLVALLLSPVATELPEMVNALIWVRQGRERLALANISGSMMIQATIPSALAIFATPWLFDMPLMAAGAVTALAIAWLWIFFRRGRVDARWLAILLALYGLFAVCLAVWFGTFGPHGDALAH